MSHNDKTIDNAIESAKAVLNKNNSDYLIQRNTRVSQELPTVSFLIPFYREYEYLITNINSILNQTYPNIKIIIVNDYPNDEMHEKLVNLTSKHNEIFLYKNDKNLGGALTMMKCMEYCDTKYALKIDQDDFYISNTFLEKAIDKLENNSNLSFVSFNTLTYIEDKNIFHTDKLNYSGFMERKDFLLNMFIVYI